MKFMNINSKFIDLCRQYNIPLNEGFIFGVLIEFKDQIPHLENFLQEIEFWPYEKWQPYQINLCETDADHKLRLKVPLFSVTPTNDNYDKFSEEVVKRVGTTIRTKDSSYSLFTKDGVERVSFYALTERLGEPVDLNKLIEVVTSYYEETTMAKQLGNFLKSEECYHSYKNFKEQESNGRLLN